MKPIYKEHKDRKERIASAVAAIKAILPLDLYLAHKKELLSVCLWKITEADGKLKVRYWSEGALINPEGKLQHEHVNERKRLITRLLDGESVESVIADVIACIVTQEEHKLLTAQKSDGWDRYRGSNIGVFDIKDQIWIINSASRSVTSE